MAVTEGEGEEEETSTAAKSAVDEADLAAKTESYR